MSLPVNIDEYSKYVVMDEDELVEQKVSAAVRDRIRRLRGIYAYWLDFPYKMEKEIVKQDMDMFRVGLSQAYDDLRIVQVLLGSFHQPSKDFLRWKINRDLERDLTIARNKGDMRAVASLEKVRVLNNRTDKDDGQQLEYDKIVPQTFELTDDPKVLGMTMMSAEEARRKAKYYKEKYSKTEIEDAEYEEVDDGEV